MIPTVLTVLLTAACVQADTSGDSAAARRAFSVDVSFAPMPSKSQNKDSYQDQRQQPYQDGLQQRQQPAPVTSMNFGSGQSWTPQAPALLERKGPPPFMPDDANSVEVPAMGPPPTTVTTTVPMPKGFFQAAMPLMSGVKNMVGQAEKGAQQLLHLPNKGEKTPSENKANAAAKAQTSRAQWKLQIAHKQEAELQAQLANVQAQLKNKEHQAPVTQEPVTQQPVPQFRLPVTQQPVTQFRLPATQQPVEAMQAMHSTQPPKAQSMEHYSQPQVTQEPVTQQPVTQKAMQASTQPPKAQSMEHPKVGSSEPADTKSKESSSAPVQAKSEKSSSEPAQATPKTTMSSSEPVPAHKAKASSSEAEQATHKASAKNDEKSRLQSLAAALRGSSDKSMERKYTATPVISTMRTQGNVLMLGSAVVAIAAGGALVVRYVRATSRGPALIEDTYENEDSGIE